MIEYFSQNLWQMWMLIGVLCLIIELTSGDLFVICFAVGGFMATLATFFSQNIYVQSVLFVVISLLCIFYVRPFAYKYLHKHDPNKASNADALMGRIGTVSEAIEKDGFGRVAIDGDDWKAISANNQYISKGMKVKVIGRDSIILTVETA